MQSGSDITKTLLKFCSVWHGVCINWNENIHSLEPCVTPVLHPPPLSSPSPAPRGGAPSNTGAQLRMGIFTPKTEKRRGGYPFGRGFTGKFLGTGKTQGGALKKGKTQEGVPVSEGGLPGNFEERENAGWNPYKMGKFREGVPLSEGGLPGKFGIKKISYYICGKNKN